jgi:hypothetical protein
VISSWFAPGVVYIDGSFGDFIVSAPEARKEVFGAAMEALLTSSKVRGLRIRLLPGRPEICVLHELLSKKSWDAQLSRIHFGDASIWQHHAHLTLPPDYETFLKQLGSTTRHNFRYYRRRFEAAGHQFVASMAMEELRGAALDLIDKSQPADMPKQPKGDLEGYLDIVAASSKPLALGLRHKDGRWVGVIGGWYTPKGAVLLFQCNNAQEFANDSLSVVLRAYCLEHLIGLGSSEFTVWAETRGPLSRYVKYPRSLCVKLDAPTVWWRSVRFALQAMHPYLPKRLATAAQWITCSSVMTMLWLSECHVTEAAEQILSAC